MWLSKANNEMLNALSRKIGLPKATIVQAVISGLFTVVQGIPHCDFRVIPRREFYTCCFVMMPEVSTISGTFKEPVNTTDEETDKHIREKLLEARGKVK